MARSRERRQCPVNECGARCTNVHTPDKLMCRTHWFQVPKGLRDEVWDAYRNEGVMSERYVEARDAAIKAVSS